MRLQLPVSFHPLTLPSILSNSIFLLIDRYNEEARAVRLLQARSEDLGRQFHQLQFEYADPTPNFDRRRVYGVVAKLFDLVNPKYATAIEVAAGGKVGLAF